MTEEKENKSNFDMDYIKKKRKKLKDEIFELTRMIEKRQIELDVLNILLEDRNGKC